MECNSSNKLSVNVDSDNVLHIAVTCLEDEGNDEYLEVKIVPLLSYFVDQIFERKKFDDGGDVWLEELVLCFCMKYFARTSSNSKPLHRYCFNLLLCSCKRPSICRKVLEMCQGFLDVASDKSFHSTSNASTATCISLDLTVQILNEVLNSMNDIEEESVKSLKQDVISSVVQILKNEDVLDSSFIHICGLLKDFIDLRSQTEVTLVWSTANHLWDRSKDIKLLLFISLLVTKIAESVIVMKPSFWVMIQGGLVSEDPLTRKRSVYVIKWILDCISESDFATNQSSEFSLLWIKERNDELWSVWKTVILLLETLDESQVHVINPVLPLINDVYAASIVCVEQQQLLHISWLLTILRRALLHQSKLLNKWAMQYCLQMNLEEHLVTSELSLNFVFLDMMKSLQLTHVYAKDESTPWGSPPLVLSMLKNFISNCLTYVGEKEAEFVNRFLQLFNKSKFNFNEISLVYLTEVLSHQHLTIHLSVMDIELFKQFCFTRMRTYRIDYQKVIFYNMSLFYTKNMVPETSIVSDIVSVLGYAIDNGFLCYSGICWKLWVEWMNKMSDICKEESIICAVQYILQNNLRSATAASGNATTWVILVIFQCLVCPINCRSVNLMALTDILDKMHSNPYLDPAKILVAMRFNNSLLENLLVCKDVSVSGIVEVLLSKSTKVFEYIQKMSSGAMHIQCQDYAIFQQCASLVNSYVSASKLSFTSVISPSLKKFFSNISEKLIGNFNSILHIKSVANDESLVPLFFSVKLMKYYLDWELEIVQKEVVLLKLVAEIIVKFDSQTFNNICKENDLCLYVNSEVVVSDLYAILTLLFEKSIQRKLSVAGLDELKHLLLDNFFSDITIVSVDHIVNVIQFSDYLVTMFVEDEEVLILIMERMWKLVKDEARSANLFWGIYQKCVRCIFHQKLLTSCQSVIIQKVREIWNCILKEGEKRINVVNVLADHCVDVWKKQENPYLSMVNYIQEIIHTATFGSFLVKATKPWDDLIYYLHASSQCNITGLKSGHWANENVRVTFIRFLLSLNHGEGASEFINQLKIALIDYALQDGNNRKAYYPNTQVHRKILRVLQLFLVLLSKYPACLDYSLVLPKLYANVKTAFQTSIRYYLEWSILMILHHDNNLIETLMHEMDVGTEKQILSVTSMMSLAAHLANLLKGVDFEVYVRKVVAKVLPWAHAQHMTSRLHAQVVLQNIWENITKFGCSSLQSEYSFLSYCFSMKADSSAAVRNRNELQNHFVYSQFHPIENYSLETIFHVLPSHIGVLSDEWITPDKFKDVYINLENQNFHLKVTDTLKLPVGNNVDEDSILISPFDKSDALGDIQMKTKPWKVLPSTDDIVLQSEIEKKKEKMSSKLILCAVLVDKIANLGGLCRTSEIFGAGKLVVGSMRYLEDKSFKSLSVSAERWLHIEQVLPIKLDGYLKSMKSEGYQVVGVEQTANSNMIGEYKFSEKTLLLLGNERTGIPVELIQLVDVCVEIPQVGIIRSLNVHISGAIMMWEYCKQHMINEY